MLSFPEVEIAIQGNSTQFLEKKRKKKEKEEMQKEKAGHNWLRSRKTDTLLCVNFSRPKASEF